MKSLKDINKSLKDISIMPTIFDFGDLWRINSRRWGGKFNLIFFWLYPIVAIQSLPFTFWCLIKRNKQND